MSAAYVSPVDRQTEWRDELERILADWAEMPAGARAAVRTVVASLLREQDVSPAEAALVRDLLAWRLSSADQVGR